MQAEEITQKLTNYKLNQANCEWYTLRIADCRRILDELMDTAIADQSLLAQQYTDMPRGTGVSDIVARVACAFAEGAIPREMSELKREIQSLEEKRRPIQADISLVNVWLVGLTEMERWVIEQQVMEDKPWRIVAVAFKKRYGVEYTLNSLRKMKGKILAKIAEMEATKIA